MPNPKFRHGACGAHYRCRHMPTDLTSKSRNHRQPEAFPHIPASWLLLCAEYKLLIFSLQKASLSCLLLTTLLVPQMFELDSSHQKPCFPTRTMTTRTLCFIPGQHLKRDLVKTCAYPHLLFVFRMLAYICCFHIILMFFLYIRATKTADKPFYEVKQGYFEKIRFTS